MGGWNGGGGGLTQSQTDALYGRIARFSAETYKTGSLTDLQAIQAACAAATAFSGAGVVQLSDRIWNVGSGLSMSGYTCGLVGVSAGDASGTPNGTVLYAPTQSGPVLDLNGWLYSTRGRIEFGDFNIQGSGIADPTLANIGLRRGLAAITNVRFHDIGISQTGGPCLDIADMYFSTLSRITMWTPVSAKANNVPYYILRGCNGNIVDQPLCRSNSSSADCGVGGAMVITDDGTNDTEGNVFINPQFENLHVPTNGTLMAFSSIKQKIIQPYFPDCAKEAAATGTSYATFSATAHDGLAGNDWDGYVPGTQGGSTIDQGIVVNQSYNRIVGVKGYNGTNVVLGSGVGYCYVALEGSEGAAANAGIVDNSGVTTNTLIDGYAGTNQQGPFTITPNTTGVNGIGVQFTKTGTPANGSCYLGNAGVSWQAISNALFNDADSMTFRNIAHTVSIASWATSSNPALTLTAPSTGQPSLKLAGGVGLVIARGGIQHNAAAKTANYTLVYDADDWVTYNGASLTATLPRADFAGFGREYTITNLNASTLTIATSASQTITSPRGVAASTDTAGQGVSRIYRSDSSNWIGLI